MWREPDIAIEIGELWRLDTDRDNEGWKVDTAPDEANVYLTDDDDNMWIVSVRPMPEMWR